MGAEAAVDVGAGAIESGAPEPAPSGGGEPTPAAAPAAAPVGEPSGQAPTPEGQPSGAEPGAAAQPSPLPEPSGVPWGKFREIQTFNTQLKGQFQAAEEQWGDERAQFQSQVEDLQAKVQSLSQPAQDHEILSNLLQNNPDIAEQLWERARTQGPTMPARGAPPGGTPAQREQYARLHPDQEKALAETLQSIQAEKQQRAEEAKQAEFAETSRQLDENLTKLLADNQYGKEFLPDARAFVMEEARRMDLGLEHIPYVFAQWLKSTESKISSRVDSIIKGKQVDSGLPAAPGGSPAPVRTAPQVGANDEQTNALMLEALRQRGFTDAG